jgi:hypothetical protein
MRYKLAQVMPPLGAHAIDASFVVMDTQTGKLTSVNLFTREEAESVVRRHNDAAALKAHWPEPGDPEVDALVREEAHRVDGSATVAYTRFQAEERIARTRAGL